MAKKAVGTNIIGPQLAALREAAGLSQTDVAAKLQLMGLEKFDRKYLSKVERGTRGIRDYEVAALSIILGIPLGPLFPEAPAIRTALAAKRVK